MVKKEKFGKICKEKMVTEILDNLKDRPNFVITTYMGSSVNELEQLRKSLKKNSSDYLVVKNSMLKVVFNKLKLDSEISKIESGMGISLSGEDIISTCKTLVTFSKDHGKFKIKGAVIDGKSVPTEKVKELASLPAKNVLLAQVVGGIKAPITGFVNTLGGVLRKFVYCVDAIKNAKKDVAGAVSAPAADQAASVQAQQAPSA